MHVVRRPDGTTGDGRGDQRGRGRGGRGGRGDQQPLSPDTPTVDLAAGQEASVLVFRAAPTPAVSSAAAPPQSVSRDTQTATGSIRGRVLSHDATPIAGASVQVTPAEGGGSRRSAVTDAAGRYEITGLAQGRYRARVTKSGLVSVEYRPEPRPAVRPRDRSRTERAPARHRRDHAEGECRHRDDRRRVGRTGRRCRRAGMAGPVHRRTNGSGACSRREHPPHRQSRAVSSVRSAAGHVHVVASREQSGGGRGGRGGRGGPGAADGADTAADLRVFYPGTPFLASANTIQADVGQDTAGVDITDSSPGPRGSRPGCGTSRVRTARTGPRRYFRQPPFSAPRTAPADRRARCRWRVRVPARLSRRVTSSKWWKAVPLVVVADRRRRRGAEIRQSTAEAGRLVGRRAVPELAAPAAEGPPQGKAHPVSSRWARGHPEDAAADDRPAPEHKAAVAAALAGAELAGCSRVAKRRTGNSARSSSPFWKARWPPSSSTPFQACE